MNNNIDTISIEEARTLDGLFRARVARSPDGPAYRQYIEASGAWEDKSWAQMAADVEQWRRALAGEGYQRGDRVAIMLRNCREWVMCDQAALSLGLVVVPLFCNDRAENVIYILENSDAKFILVDGEEQWAEIKSALERIGEITRVVSARRIANPGDARVVFYEDWLRCEGEIPPVATHTPDDLATIVYTSGTTGKPKGVMLTHHNIVWNANTGLDAVEVRTSDVFLSFLPLSHMFERTIGYYLTIMAGATVAYARSIPQLSEDLLIVRPTIMISVPRIFERVAGRIKEQLQEKPPLARKLFEFAAATGWARFEARQGRGGWRPAFLLLPLLQKLVGDKVLAKLGGRMRYAIVGGAALAPKIAELFIGLGLDMLQGYGLTETSPVLSVNRASDNQPFSVGPKLRDVEVRIGEGDELCVRSPGIMKGYWKNEQASKEVIDEQGWFHSGDKARIADSGHIYIIGRLKEILVLANGEKVPPADMEAAINDDVLFEQCLVIGEAKPYLSAIIVLNREQWEAFAQSSGFDLNAGDVLSQEAVQEKVLDRIAGLLTAFPGYAQIRRVALTLDAWTVDDGLITPTLKLRRKQILERHAADVENLYAGH